MKCAIFKGHLKLQGAMITYKFFEKRVTTERKIGDDCNFFGMTKSRLVCKSLKI